MSNAFLPGYWPHSALYVGTAKDLERLGLLDDPRVKKHWQKFLKRDEFGHEHVIIESVSEGVIFSSLEHSIGGGDSAAVLRPRLNDAKTRECIARAFSHVGKPYDFEKMRAVDEHHAGVAFARLGGFFIPNNEGKIKIREGAWVASNIPDFAAFVMIH